jgi:hypothetical protein
MVIIIIIKFIYFSSLRIVSFFRPDTATALFPLRQESDWPLMGSSAECQLFLHQPSYSPPFLFKRPRKAFQFFCWFHCIKEIFYLLPPCRKEQRPVNSRIMAAVVTGHSRGPPPLVLVSNKFDPRLVSASLLTPQLVFETPLSCLPGCALSIIWPYS